MSRQAKDFTKGKSKFNPKNRGNFKGKGTSGKKGNITKSDDESELRGRDSRSMNDITWYALNEQLLRDTSSFPYAWMTGLAMRQNRVYEDSDNYVVPGILAANVTLSPLTLNNAADPVNVAARSIVGYIRSFNSGAKNYDPNDLMIRFLAEGNFLAFLNYAIRVYATINMYSSYNKYMPRDLLRIQSIDPDDIREHMADYRAALNTIITKASSIIYVPTNIPLFKRWSWLFSNYYSDSNNPKDQIYLLTPTGYSYFTIDEDTSMGKLQYVQWNADDQKNPVLNKWDDIINALNKMLDPLIEDQELCIMTGDMIKAYGASAIGFQLVPESLTAIPSHDPLVLQQFKCARTLPTEYPNDGGNWRDVVQNGEATYLTRGGDYKISDRFSFTYDQGGMVQTGTDASGLGYEEYHLLYADAVLDSPNPSPTAVDNMENTRLIAMPLDTISDFSENPRVLKEWTAGSEVIEYFTMGYRYLYTYNGQPVYGFGKSFFRTAVNVLITDEEELYNISTCPYVDFNAFPRLMADLETFDYAPTVYLSWSSLNPDTGEANILQKYRKPHMRISNFALLSGPTLEKMNNCALLSELNITGFQPK